MASQAAPASGTSPRPSIWPVTVAAIRAERATASGPRGHPRFTWLRVRTWAFSHSRQPLAVRPSRADAALEGLRNR